MFKRFVLCCALLGAFPAWAGNGHLLHGIGAINSSMGGAGVGLPMEVLSSLHGNPALLAQHKGTQVGISTEFFKPDLSMATKFTDAKFGSTSWHTTPSDDELGVLPAVGWSLQTQSGKLTFGWGLLAAAGFRTNWPADDLNIVLERQPYSFGRLATDLAITKVPFSLAWQARPDLAVGASLVLYQGKLVIQPLPTVPLDCPDADGNGKFENKDCEPDANGLSRDRESFRPSTSAPVSSYAPAVQVGLYYQPTDMVSVGASFTTKQDFDDYEWNSEHLNPSNTDPSNPTSFYAPQKVQIGIDGPPIASIGIGLRPMPKLSIALDGRWVGYKKTDGIGEPGYTKGSTGVRPDQTLIGIGWRNIMIGMLGVQYQASPKLAVRGGLNFNQSPIKPSRTLNSGGTPSTFEQHYTLGVSTAVTEQFDVSLGFYYTPKNSISGPIYDSAGFQPAEVKLTNGIVSGIMAFSFRF